MADNTNDNFQTNTTDEPKSVQDVTDDMKLQEDNDTPFSPPDGVQDRIDDTHQVTDTNVDAHERYDAGIEAASGVDLPGQAADEDQADIPETL